MSSIIVGIDISKDKFDVCILKEKSKEIQRSFPNSSKGFQEFSKILSSPADISVALEATGRYGENLCRFLHSRGIAVFVLNPAIIKYYAKSRMLRVKTDKADARLITEYLQLHQASLHSWQPRSQSLETVRELHRYVESLKDDRVRLFGHIEACQSSDRFETTYLLKLYQQRFRLLTKQIEGVTSKIFSIIESCIELKKRFELLEGIPGIGSITAIALLAELPDVSLFVSPKQLAAYAGLNPAIKESGSSVRGKGGLSKVGCKRLRKLLYFPALSALRFNTVIKEFGDRLRDKGKKGKVLIAAAMRKLLHLIYGVLKSGKPFAERIGAAAAA